MSKPVKDNAVTKLIQLIKNNFIKQTDITTTTLIDVDSTPTTSSTNLVTSGGVKTYVDTKVSDVKIDGTTIVTSGVANIPIADASTLGVVQVDSQFGISNSEASGLIIECADEGDIDFRFEECKPIVPYNLDYAVRSVRPIYSTDWILPLNVNTIYNVGIVGSEISLTLPATAQHGDFIQFDFVTSGATRFVLSSSGGLLISDYDAEVEAGKIYSFFCDYGVCNIDVTQTPPQTDGWRISRAEYELPPSNA